MIKMFWRLFFFVTFMNLTTCVWKYEMSDYANMKILRYSILSTEITNVGNGEVLMNKLLKGVYFQITLTLNQKYKLFIRKKTASVVNTRTEFYVFEDDSTKYNYNADYSCGLVEGYVVNEISSYVVGYVEDVYFYGKIILFSATYYIEKLSNYPELQDKHKSNKNAVAFERNYESDANATFYGINYKPEKITMNSKIFKRMTLSGKMCSLLVLIDNSFIRVVHGGNIKGAIKQVLLSIDEANSLFRSTDFDEDGYPDNVGFLIKYFIILKSSSNSRWIPKFTKNAIDGRFYMRKFSRFYLLEDVCLGVAFTGQSFYHDIVGISYTAVPADKTFRFPYGGICDRPLLNPFGISLNTLAVSAKSEDGRTVPQYIFDLSLCHELGHSFGADHDKKECDGYLMTAHAPNDQQRKHFMFSNCSKSMMLETITRRGLCFETDENPYCGNGIIENDEECDCGTVRDCLEFDKCCVPRGRINACKIKRDMGYVCHPLQGLCCNKNCRYQDLQKYDLDCTDFQNACPCLNSSLSCECGVKGRCTQNICSSIECTRIGAEECECPTLGKTIGCVTCCSSKHKNIPCAPASVVTGTILESDESLLMELKMEEEKRKMSNNFKHKSQSRFETTKTFCSKGNCVSLEFRKVKQKQYCLLFGQVGKCSNKLQCVLPSQLELRMQFQSVRKSRAGISYYNTKNWLRLKLFVLFYTINVIKS